MGRSKKKIKHSKGVTPKKIEDNEIEEFEADNISMTKEELDKVVSHEPEVSGTERPVVEEVKPTGPKIIEEEPDEEEEEPVEEKVDKSLERVNDRQIDIVENFELREGITDRTLGVPEIYTLENNKLATSVVNKMREFVKVTAIRPYVSVEDKIELKYHMSLLVEELFEDPKAIKVSIVNLASEKSLLLHAVAMAQLTARGHWKYDQELLSRIDIFLNLVTIYDYKLRGVDTQDTRPDKTRFKSFLFKSGATRTVANTLADLLY